MLSPLAIDHTIACQRSWLHTKASVHQVVRATTYEGIPAHLAVRTMTVTYDSMPARLSALRHKIGCQHSWQRCSWRMHALRATCERTVYELLTYTIACKHGGLRCDILIMPARVAALRLTTERAAYDRRSSELRAICLRTTYDIRWHACTSGSTAAGEHTTCEQTT